MNEDELPDFLQLNGFGRPGMFGARNPLTGSGGSGATWLSRSPLTPAGPTAAQCPLVPLNPLPGTVASNGNDLRFSPAFADVLRKATDTLSRQGIRLDISNGFRTAADQLRMRQGGSGKNPAALYSDHQLGNGIDINGTRLSTFPAVVQAFKQAGARWGGDYHGWRDHPHFYIRPVRANARNTAECERENPR